MRHRARWVAAIGLAVGLFVVCSCESPSPEKGGENGTDTVSGPVAKAFRHDLSSDVSGYYLPRGRVQQGDLRLMHLSVGPGFAFDDWEGGQRSATYGPVMMVFEDVTAAPVQTELGPQPGVTIRVLPTRYTMTDTGLTFEGTADRLGRVTFEGRLDQDALATARRNLGDSEAPVLTGDLSIGRQTYRGVTLGWFGGD